ncbi:DUF421 domain-containing protein [Cytobacillus dafuensis]|uniref:DUF421 domain-containing protein n=1 Tax=Cytobacillus dafuensis TaxID=1742359 RepID=A0A5B8Z375_CYTDA|nr:DUF421 domain-containing protein [Cytobacillus dafuensis]QED46723.1 DUF421 domain-containing protein [Cytobacillus dafuensis]
MSLKHITIDLVVAFIFLYIIVKIVGRKIINQISPFTFITSIVLSEMLGNAMYEERIGVFYILYSMSLWGAMLLTVEYLDRKFLFFRGLTHGKPIALIKNGVIDIEGLKKGRLNLNQLQGLLRESETFSIREVAFCYLEGNGSLSILKKSRYQKTKQENFNFPAQTVYMPITLIRDGVVLWDELKELGFDESWLKNQLISKGVTHYEDVFLAEWLEEDGIFVQSIHH